MNSVPKSLRLQIGIFGRTNVGKSSFLNAIAGQDVAITSPNPGTTTDVVEKVMELAPIGPVVFLDTAGLDDTSELGLQRIAKTKKVFLRADVIVLLTTAGNWGSYENEIVATAKKHCTPVIPIINKIDVQYPEQNFIQSIGQKIAEPLLFSCTDITLMKMAKEKFIKAISKIDLASGTEKLPLISDLLPPGGLVIFVVPIDLGAPKGRLILPQVQALRDTLDAHCMSLIVKESEYSSALQKLSSAPNIVVCDSQCVKKVVAETPPNIKVTTFSTLFARFKGDFTENVKALAIIDTLQDGNKVLIAEACTHHASDDDIGRVKIPRWLKEYLGKDIHIDIASGRDFPDMLSDYTLIVQCGSCMITHKEVQLRTMLAKNNHIAITNYGLLISFLQGVIQRVLEPFPEQLAAYKNAVEVVRPAKVQTQI